MLLQKKNKSSEDSSRGAPYGAVLSLQPPGSHRAAQELVLLGFELLKGKLGQGHGENFPYLLIWSEYRFGLEKANKRGYGVTTEAEILLQSSQDSGVPNPYAYLLLKLPEGCGLQMGIPGFFPAPWQGYLPGVEVQGLTSSDQEQMRLLVCHPEEHHHRGWGESWEFPQGRSFSLQCPLHTGEDSQDLVRTRIPGFQTLPPVKKPQQQDRTHPRGNQPDSRAARQKRNSSRAWADLHTHTTASDGSMGPSRLVETACQIGLGALGITDHDTLGGVEEALARGKTLGILVIPGVEISVDMGDGRSFHLLGYGVEPESDCMQAFLRGLRENRAERNLQILERLARLGYPLEEKDLDKPIAQAGRPHLAMAMVRRGHVSSADEAFARFLGRDARAYVPKKRPLCAQAIEVILRSGGVPVLAHPHTAGYQGLSQLKGVLQALADCGLMGIEALYPDAPPGLGTLCQEMALKRGLLFTGGSDFHGRFKPHIRLGFGRGTLKVPLEWAESLNKAVERVKRGFFLDKPGSRV